MQRSGDSLILPVIHIHQHADGECLAACAAMVLNYRGLNAAYPRLLHLLKIGDFGAPFPNLLRLESLKVAVILNRNGTLQTVETLLRQGHPCIVPVDTGELPYWDRQVQHALVIVGIDETSIYVNDPDLEAGPVQLSQDDFMLAWLPFDEEYAIIK